MARILLSGCALSLLVGLSCLDADCEPGDPSCQLLAVYLAHPFCTYPFPSVTLEEYTYPGSAGFLLNTMTAANGRLFAGARATAPTNRWIVRAIDPNGQSAFTSDDYVHPLGPASVQSIVGDGLGRIYATGIANTAPDRWVTRASYDSGSTWLTVDERTEAGGASGSAVFTGLEGAFAAGSVGSNLEIRRETAGAWVAEASFSPINSSALGEFAQLSPGLLALSYGMDDGGGNATIGVFVRSGGSWTRVDAYIPSGYLSANPRSIDAGFGALYVTAELNDGANLHSLLRRSTDGGASWQDLKFFNAQQVDVISSVRSGWAPGMLFAFGVRGTLAMNTPIVDVSRDGGLSWTTIQTDSVAGSTSTGNGYSTRAAIGDVYYATSHNAGGERFIARRIRCY